jgi:hypothetical protein
MFNTHMWLVATILENTDKEYFHHHKKFHWAVLSYKTIIKHANLFRFDLNTHIGKIYMRTNRVLSLTYSKGSELFLYLISQSQ